MHSSEQHSLSQRTTADTSLSVDNRVDRAREGKPLSTDDGRICQAWNIIQPGRLSLSCQWCHRAYVSKPQINGSMVQQNNHMSITRQAGGRREKGRGRRNTWCFALFALSGLWEALIQNNTCWRFFNSCSLLLCHACLTSMPGNLLYLATNNSSQSRQCSPWKRQNGGFLDDTKIVHANYKVQKVHACEKTLDKTGGAVGSIDHALEIHKSSLLVLHSLTSHFYLVSVVSFAIRW